VARGAAGEETPREGLEERLGVGTVAGGVVGGISWIFQGGRYDMSQGKTIVSIFPGVS
jgi:hypothetical protein